MEVTVKTTRIVSREEWLSARRAHLDKEKALDKQRDQLSRERRELPWVKVDKNYRFDGPEGREALSDLFGKRHQLIVYHFMYDPSWQEGCPSCSYLADHFDGMLPHLDQRDVAFVVVSKALPDQLEAYKERLGWSFKWVSSHDNEFNRDYHVSFTPEELEKGEAYYNYKKGTQFPSTEGPGLSVFYKDENGNVFHTYSTYARGLDHLIGTYQFLDLVPKGRDEDDLDFSMAWIRRHDEYVE
jgi:predicted dithiol-disulfide oxidoreductase (DUF899 family)